MYILKPLPGLEGGNPILLVFVCILCLGVSAMSVCLDGEVRFFSTYEGENITNPGQNKVA